MLLFLTQFEYVTEKVVTESEGILETLEILVYFSMFYFISFYFILWHL